MVTSRRIEGDGTPAALWRGWLDHQALPLIDVSRLVATVGRLVVVAPHPDDEVLACGGLLALCATHGVSATVVAVTDGGGSHGELDAAYQRQLCDVRRAESVNGLHHLGVVANEIVRLGVADGSVAAQQSVIEDSLVGLLTHNDLVVTTWARDGHPDHEASSRAVARACQTVGCAAIQAPVWMWHWAEPGDKRVPWEQMVALPLPPLPLAAKQRALACHQSQLTPRPAGQPPVLGPEILQRADWPCEYFFVEGSTRDRLFSQLL